MDFSSYRVFRAVNLSGPQMSELLGFEGYQCLFEVSRVMEMGLR